MEAPLNIINEATGLRFEWNRAHTVNVYDDANCAVDCYSIGDFAVDAANLDRFEESVSEWMDSRYEDSAEEDSD